MFSNAVHEATNYGYTSSHVNWIC